MRTHLGKLFVILGDGSGSRISSDYSFLIHAKKWVFSIWWDDGKKCKGCNP